MKRAIFLSAAAAIGALGGSFDLPQITAGGRWYQADLRQWRRRRDRNGKRRRRGSRP